MQRNIRFLVVVLVIVGCALATVPVGATTTRAASTSKELDAETQRGIRAIVNATKNGAGVPGMIVCVWDPARGTFLEGFGTADLDNPTTTIATDDHVRIASVTKSFTTTAIVQLVADEKLLLDAHVSEFVPDIPDGDQITVHQVLDMTAGVFSYTEDEAWLQAYFANPQMPFTAQDALTIIRAHQPDFAPGTDVHCSDSNYVLLQLIAEKVTGQPLGAVIQSQILDKVGLDSTSYPTTDAIPEPFSHGYLAQPLGGPRDVTLGNSAGGAGAMVSTVEDLHRWVDALGKGTLLPKSFQKERLQTHPLAKTPKLTLAYGMGITNANGFLGHDGGTLGFATAAFYVPKAKAPIVVASNSDNVSGQSALWTFIGLASYLYPGQFPKGL